MEARKVRMILNYEELAPVMALISLVNLKDIELDCIKMVDIRGLSENACAYDIKRCRNSVQNARRRAYKKLGKVWDNNTLALEILRRMEGK